MTVFQNFVIPAFWQSKGRNDIERNDILWRRKRSRASCFSLIILPYGPSFCFPYFLPFTHCLVFSFFLVYCFSRLLFILGWYLQQSANNESSVVIDILLPVTFYFNPSTRLDNVKNLWRFVISQQSRSIHRSKTSNGAGSYITPV